MKKSKNVVTVLIAEPDATILNGLKLLVETEDDLSVIGQAHTLNQMLEQTRKLHPDVILMDFINSDAKGLKTVTQIKNEFPGTKVIILTTYPTAVKEALRAGASHFFLKDCIPEELFAAIRASI